MKPGLLVICLGTALTAFEAGAVSFECEINGHIVYQSTPCTGVKYPKNLTQPSLYGETTLSDQLAARGAAAEAAKNADAMVAAQNRRLQAEYQAEQQYLRTLNRAEEYRVLEAQGIRNNNKLMETIGRNRAQEFENAVR